MEWNQNYYSYYYYYNYYYYYYYSVFVGPLHGMVLPQDANGGTANDMEASCK